MNILITGAAGFIGFHLAKTLVEKGHRVRGLLMPQENDAALIDLGVEIYRGDLTRPDSLVGVAADMDIVYHLAARTLDWGTRKQFETVMVDGTSNLLEESQGHVSRFVYCSSVAGMGLGRDLSGLNEDAERKICGIPYCDTKIIAEDLVADFCRRNSLDYTIIRPPMTRLAAGVMGKDLSVDSSRARQELGWKSRVSQEEALERIKIWVETEYH